VAGTLDKINFTDGQLVKEGDLLFIIDPRPFQIAVESAKADVTKARARVALAGTDGVRTQQLATSRRARWISGTLVWRSRKRSSLPP
jgi:membrane fusion protein, multidrug efflux system